MTNILLAGIVGVGKSSLVDATQRICAGLEERFVSVSVGDMMRESARFAGLDEERLLHAPHATQHAILSGGVLDRTAIEILERESGRKDSHFIIDAPLTLSMTGGVIMRTIDLDMRPLKIIGRNIDYVVVVIDDPRRTAERLAGSQYTGDISDVLTWTSAEIMRAEDLAGRCTPGRPPLILPYDSSRTSLAKLLLDKTPNVIYPIRPISAVVKLEKSEVEADRAKAAEARRLIVGSDDLLQRCGIITSPIEVVGYGPSQAELEHTIYRDFRFVNQANAIVGHYPFGLGSVGGDMEFAEAYRLAKLAAMINPAPNMHPFGHGRIPFMFQDLEQFRAALESGDQKYAPLKRFTAADGKTPKYARIEDIARRVA